jgi:hypothetical protein
MIYLLLSLALACTPQEKFKTKCEDYCWIDQRLDKSLVLNNKCYCGVPVDLDKELNFVPKIGSTFKDKNHIYTYSVSVE